MKLRALSIIACVLLCASCAFAQTVTNMLLNTGFETPAAAVDVGGEPLPNYWTNNCPSGWTKGGTWGNFVRRNWRSHSGEWEGGIPAQWKPFTSANYGGCWQSSTNTVIVGETYKATVWIWGDGDLESWKNEWKLEFYRSNGSGPIYAVTNIFVTPGTDWQQISVEGVAPANAAEVRVVISASGMGVHGTLQFDDIELIRVPQLPAIVITNPASSNAVVEYATSQYTLKGTSQRANGNISWTNAATGVYGSFTASSSWSASAIHLVVGNNLITVTATNTDGVASDSVTILRHAPAPAIYIISPLSGTVVGNDVNSYTVYGSCNTNTLGIRWDNGHGSSGPVTIYNGNTWTATVALAYGANSITIAGTNSTGEEASQSVSISRESYPPGISIDDPESDITVPNGTAAYTVIGSCFDGAVGTLVWSNSLTGEGGSFPCIADWSIDVGLDVGVNTISATCTNAGGEPATVSVSITRQDLLPVIVITTPSSDINVGNSELSYTLLGTWSTSVVGKMSITNAQTGEFRWRDVPTVGKWRFTNMVLREGPNVITVYGSNITGQVGSDSVTIYRDYVKADLWINEMHYVNVSDADADDGFEIAGPAYAVLDQYSLYLYNSNGLVYGSNSLSGEIDSETNGFGAVWFGYGRDVIKNGPRCGVALAFKDELMEFISYRGTVDAHDGPASGLTSTDIGITEGRDMPINNSLQLQGVGTTGTDFIWCGPLTNSYGRLNPGQIVSGDRDGNGIPDVWQDLYFPPSSNVTAAADADGDGFSNISEFYADTNPTDAGTYPEIARLQVIGGYPVLNFSASAQRSYLVQKRNNLISGGWTNSGAAFMGPGGVASIVVPDLLTNEFFRYKVWMPGVE